jgi:hypothetical protein
LNVLSVAPANTAAPADAWELRIQGKLKLLSPCAPQAWKLDHDWQISLYCDAIEIGKGFLDKKERDIEKREVWLLEVESNGSATRKSRGIDRLCGLLLEKCKGFEDKFERIGFALRKENSTIFEDFEARIILLV